MPEMRFVVIWPDGREEICYSPSLVVKEYLEVGADYPLAEFVARSRTSLTIASDRVKAKYGYPCSLAQAQLARIEADARTFSTSPDARVRCKFFLD